MLGILVYITLAWIIGMGCLHPLLVAFIERHSEAFAIATVLGLVGFAGWALIESVRWLLRKFAS